MDTITDGLPEFRRGVTLTTAATYGHGSTSDLGPTEGNRFDELFAGDLALLGRLGVTDLRLTFDWPRLQPTPGRLDEFWAEHVDEVLDTAATNDLRVWATLHDGGAPRWLDDEGGTGDDAALTRWWPRWVEHVAERFGDRMHGWIPFAGIARDMPMRPWADTWGILRNPSSLVVASLARADLDRIERFHGSCDRIGLVLHAPDETVDDLGAEPTDGELDRLTERLATDIHRGADAAEGIGVLISQFTAHHGDADTVGAMTRSMVRAVDDAVADGIDLRVVFADPAIRLPSTATGLVDRDRAVLPAGSAYFTDLG